MLVFSSIRTRCGDSLLPHGACLVSLRWLAYVGLAYVSVSVLANVSCQCSRSVSVLANVSCPVSPFSVSVSQRFVSVFQ